MLQNVDTYYPDLVGNFYNRYLDNQTTRANGSQRRASIRSKTSIKVALFGMGRAGSIHLANIIANPRIELAYVVESDSRDSIQ